MVQRLQSPSFGSFNLTLAGCTDVSSPFNSVLTIQPLLDPPMVLWQWFMLGKKHRFRAKGPGLESQVRYQLRGLTLTWPRTSLHTQKEGHKPTDCWTRGQAGISLGTSTWHTCMLQQHQALPFLSNDGTDVPWLSPDTVEAYSTPRSTHYGEDTHNPPLLPGGAAFCQRAENNHLNNL